MVFRSKMLRYSTTVIMVLVLHKCEGALNLEDQESSEHNFQYFENHNFHENDNFQKDSFPKNHFHKDAFCDCNSQGPWRPLFKPSQQIESELAAHDVIHNELSNSIENNLRDEEHFPPLPNQHFNDDLHPQLHQHPAGRKGKKQNHMIHLHLIPHIYVPIVHPVSYAVHENDQHQTTSGETSQELQGHNFPTNNPPDDLGSEHQLNLDHSHQSHLDQSHLDQSHLDHSQENQVPSHLSYSEFLHHQVNPYYSGHTSEAGNHNSLISESGYTHETPDEIIHARFREHQLPAQYIPYSDHTARHQYQVHEDSNREYGFGNYASGSSANPSIVVPAPDLHDNSNNGTDINMKNIPSGDRSKYGKRYLDIPANNKRLRFMAPPLLGQQETWLRHLSPMRLTHHQLKNNPNIDVKSPSTFKTVFEAKPNRNNKGNSASFFIKGDKLHQQPRFVYPVASNPQGNILADLGNLGNRKRVDKSLKI